LSKNCTEDNKIGRNNWQAYKLHFSVVSNNLQTWRPQSAEWLWNKTAPISQRTKIHSSVTRAKCDL